MDTRQGEKWELWRNCGRFLRTWWRENHSRILHNRILFIEHDVKINGCLPDWRGRGIAGKDIKTPHDHPDWHWWIEIAGLAGQGVRGAGVAPLGVLFVTREAMNRIAAPEWDHLFGKDLFCELRLPSAVASCDLPVEQVALPWVSDAASQIDRNLPGIHHPVKS